MRASVVGVLLAAGAGRRMGAPKALVTDATGLPWVVGTARRLLHGGCDPVRVVLGAQADEAARALADEPVDVVVAANWSEGMGASLRAGLDRLEVLAPAATAALVHLVDLPDVGVDAVRRLVRHADSGRDTVLDTELDTVLARAAYGGTPGHPVLLGRAHWAAAADSARADRGARGYLAARAVDLVECGDLASGRDVDRP